MYSATTKGSDMNEQPRQAELADEMEAAARRLAESTRSIRTVVSPSDSYALLGAMRSTVADLGQISQQLARWHDCVVEGVEHVGEDERGDGRGAATAAQALRQATKALETAAADIAAAHSANGVVCWRSGQDDEQ